MPLKDRLPALGYRDYRNFILGSFISNVGGSVQYWAVNWHVYHLTGSSAMVGLTAGIRILPLLVFSMIGGVVADTHDRRKTLLVCQIALALIAVAIGLTTLSGFTNVWVLIGLVTLNVIPMSFNNPTRQAYLTTLVPREHFPNAVSVNGMQWRLSEILGPMIAGLLIGLPFGAENGLTLCYLLNALTFIALIYVVWILPASPEPPEKERMTVPLMLTLIKDGISFVWKKPILRDTMTLDFFATLLSGAEALYPAFAVKLGLGPEGYGFLASAAGIGALAAAGTLSVLPPISRQGRCVLWMILAYGLCTIGFGVAPNLVTAMIFLAGTGAADMTSTVLRQTIRQLNTPDSVRGRMSATSMIFNITGPRLGDLEAGVLAKLVGERLSVVYGGIGCLIVGAIYWLRAKDLRDYVHEA